MIRWQRRGPPRSAHLMFFIFSLVKRSWPHVVLVKNSGSSGIERVHTLLVTFVANPGVCERAVAPAVPSLLLAMRSTRAGSGRLHGFETICDQGTSALRYLPGLQQGQIESRRPRKILMLNVVRCGGWAVFSRVDGVVRGAISRVEGVHMRAFSWFW